MSNINKSNQRKPNGGVSMALLTVLNVALFCLSLYCYHFPKLLTDKQTQPNVVIENMNSPVIVVHDESTITNKVDNVVETCDDVVWCSIKMPPVSYFRFDPPTDIAKWNRAQRQASSGEQVLLKKVIKVFPNHYDFIDGDISFRKLHYAFDFFVDERRDLSPLRRGSIIGTSRKLKANTATTSAAMVNGKLSYPWELEGKRVIPEPYDFRAANRSAVVSVGYTAYTRDSQSYFSGNRVGGAFIDRPTFFKHWKAVRDDIDIPFIAICSLNENWGFLSTNFPNRTAGWGQCCTQPKDKDVLEFLNHPKTLMLATNQHFNLSHPKLLSLPRGIPVTWGHTRILFWDAMRLTVPLPKNKLLFAAASSWGPRPQILRCISAKMDQKDFDGHVESKVPSNRLDRGDYYKKLGTSMFGLGLPGLGYDCFRNWELMTMGSIVVLERGVGLDRTMYRLPALLLEDFDEITPTLLRTAYVEALYRADEFEFERLTQSFWWSVIANVSISKDINTLLSRFPMEAEEPRFSRPRVPYECGKTDTCGRGTNRTPKKSC